MSGVNLNANCLDVFVRPTLPGRHVAVMVNPPTAYAPLTDDCLTGRGPISLDRPADDNAVTVKGHADAANRVPLSITLHDPSLFAGTVLGEAVAAAGVHVTGVVRRDAEARGAVARGDPAYAVLAGQRDAAGGRPGPGQQGLHEPVRRVPVQAARRRRQRRRRRVVGQRHGRPSPPSAARSASPADQVTLDDGCGLSKANAVTAGAVTQVLTYDFASANAKAFMDSLAVAGEDGTLAERFVRGSLRGRVLAKTGTVNGVSCLSGYLHAANGQWYCFSILMNHLAGGGKPVQERLVRVIDVAAGG